MHRSASREHNIERTIWPLVWPYYPPNATGYRSLEKIASLILHTTQNEYRI